MLAAFDMFVLHTAEGDIDDVTRILDGHTTSFRDNFESFEEEFASLSETGVTSLNGRNGSKREYGGGGSASSAMGLPASSRAGLSARSLVGRRPFQRRWTHIP